MMEIDIRKQTGVDITSIRFGDSVFDVIERTRGENTFTIAKEDQGRLYIDDIDNIILALQKAKELWS